MSYLVLARKWRPTTFEDVVGQEHITRTLSNAVLQDRVAHALLFTGSRGVGKTSCARILAKTLNCVQAPTIDPCGVCGACVEITSGSSIDVFEIDGASNNSVEQIREIREAIKFAPTQGKRKIYIIDEVHMLTTSAFNALLKTLEEPPSHALFIFATTEPHKIPETILSRCQRFDFKRIPEIKIINALSRIGRNEGLQIEDGVYAHIAREAKGGMRDALSLLDQIIAFCGVEATEAQVREVLGIADRRVMHELTQAILDGAGQRALEIIEDLFQFGLDLQKFGAEMVKHLRDLMVIKVTQTPGQLVDLPEAELETMRRQVEGVAPAQIHRLFNAMLTSAEEIARSSFPKLVLEMTLLRLCAQGTTLPLAEILVGLERLEARINEGAGADQRPFDRGAAQAAAQTPATPPVITPEAPTVARSEGSPWRARVSQPPSPAKPSAKRGAWEPTWSIGRGQHPAEAASPPSEGGLEPRSAPPPQPQKSLEPRSAPPPQPQKSLEPRSAPPPQPPSHRPSAETNDPTRDAQMARLDQLLEQIPQKFNARQIAQIARLMRFEGAQLTLSAAPQVSSQLQGQLSHIIAAGQAQLGPEFQVSLIPASGPEEAGETLHEWREARAQARREAMRREARDNPGVLAVFKVFSDAKITQINVADDATEER